MLSKGENLSHYKIISTIGAGGMGEVYLAEDTKLERQVALKVLLDDVADDADRVRRFVQEAKAASALNHPNILTVYEIGEHENSRYIATELIKGETLRDRLQHESLTLRDTLDVAMQVAAALNAAHGAGIVHRDIKPENIMLRDDGFVKVLDFGLAKLTEKQPETSSSEDATRAQVHTRPGMVMGTVAYMSPEQARGKEVDARSDIWSLGVVVYEMLAKQTPFAGETPNDSIAAILAKDPPPLGEAIPSELQRIIRKSLQKNADERYQTVKDFLLDIKNLKRELEFSEELERSNIPAFTRSTNVAAGTTENATAMLGVPSAAGVFKDTQEMPPKGGTQNLSSAEYIISEIKQHKTGALLAVILVLAIVAGGFGAYKYFGTSTSTSGTAFEKTKVTKMTKNGKVISTALSPDGKYFAHVISDMGQQAILVRQTTANNDITVVPLAPVEYWGITFSRDSNDLYFVQRERGQPGVLYRIPALGGSPQRLMARLDSTIAFSPDGKKLAFVRSEFPSKEESALIVANSDGTGEQTLATRKMPERFAPLYFVGPSWSPDGTRIATAVAGFDAGWTFRAIAVNVGDGKETILTKENWGYIGRVEWLADGKGAVIVAREQSGSYRQLWYLSLADGTARQITNDFIDYRSLSVTADATRLVTAQSDRFAGGWIAPFPDITQARQVVPPASEGVVGMSWTPNGKIVYFHDSLATTDIWIMDADGSNKKQLTTNARSNHSPQVSPDGSLIVFTSGRTGMRNIWTMGIDGSNQKQLTGGFGDDDPTFSADGKWIIYASYYPETQGLWKVPVDGGSPIRLTEGKFEAPAVSPDGKLIAALYLANPTAPDQNTNQIVTLSIDGGPVIKTFDLTNSPTTGAVIVWSPDGKSVLYNRVQDNIANLWSQPITGGEPKQISDFKDSFIYSFYLSRDGKQIAISRGNLTRDAIMLSTEK